ECADSFSGMLTSILGGQTNGDNADDDAAYKELLAKTKDRVQTIDFTNIDKGWMGHSIPDDLICSLSFTGKPPKGISLVEENSGNRGKAANFFAKLTKIKDEEPASKGFGKLLKVVKVSGDQPTVASAKVSGN